MNEPDMWPDTNVCSRAIQEDIHTDSKGPGDK